MPNRPVSGLSLYLGRLERAFGGLFVDLLKRWSNPSRFCTKPKKAARPLAEEETPAEPVEGVAQGDEQSEAPWDPRRKRKPLRPPKNSPQGADQGKLDDTWGQFE